MHSKLPSRTDPIAPPGSAALTPGEAAPYEIVRDVYEALREEALVQPYSSEERAMLADPILYYGRFLDDRTHDYALDAVTFNISRAIDYLGLGGAAMRVLDVGSGLGQQSIIFAALGCRVVGVDHNEAAVKLARRRVAFYERLLRRPLDVEFVHADFSAFDRGRGTYDRLFSMSALSHIPPLVDTVARCGALLAPEARMFLWDINPGWLYFRRLLERRVPPPGRIAAELRRNDFQVDLLTGGTAVPFRAWQMARRLALHVNAVARRSVGCSFTFVLGASRRHPTLRM